jgi:DNA-binding HxlR family transcriptional regulator
LATGPFALNGVRCEHRPWARVSIVEADYRDTSTINEAHSATSVEEVGVTRYGQFCPVAKASEIFAERWTPLILRELLSGSHRFSELEHGLPRISPSLLAQRHRFLESAGLVQRRFMRGSHSPEYHLTDAGQDLCDVVIRLGEWSHRWFNPLVDERDLDPQFLM